MHDAGAIASLIVTYWPKMLTQLGLTFWTAMCLFTANAKVDTELEQTRSVLEPGRDFGSPARPVFKSQNDGPAPFFKQKAVIITKSRCCEALARRAFTSALREGQCAEIGVLIGF